VRGKKKKKEKESCERYEGFLFGKKLGPSHHIMRGGKKKTSIRHI